MRSRGWMGAFVALVMALAPAGAAHAAGTYDVWSCRDADGGAAPTTGWTLSGSIQTIPATLSPPSVLRNTCATAHTASLDHAVPDAALGAQSSYSLFAAFGPTGPGWHVPAGQNVRMTYAAPVGLRIAKALLNFSAVSAGPRSDDRNAIPMASVVAGPDAASPDADLAGCGTDAVRAACGSGGLVSIPVNASSFAVSVRCGAWEGLNPGQSDHSCITVDSGYRSYFEIQRASVTLADAKSPTLTNVAGAASSTAAVSGIAPLTFTAADTGGGVFRADVKVDGQLVGTIGGDSAGDASCLPTGRTTGFTDPRPCPASIDMSTSIDTTLFTNAAHTLSVELQDAAGNLTELRQPLVIFNPVAQSPAITNDAPTAGAGAPLGPAATAPGNPARLTAQVTNGTGGAAATGHFASPAKKPRFVDVDYGRSAAVTDRVVDAKGKAITGAVVEVYRAPTGSGLARTLVTAVKSDARGRVSFPAPTEADATFVLSYSRQVGGAAVDTRTVELRVHAGVTLRATARSAVRGESVGFSGKVTAGVLPKRGARVVIRARQNGGRWSLAAVPRTNADGTFSWSHRFRLAGKFVFRAQVLDTDGLTVRPGESPTIPVRIS